VDNFNDARKWLEFAERDYNVAIHLNEAFRPLPVENICYSCQQSIEKSLKSILIFYAGDAPKAHDIELLQEMCKEYDVNTSMAQSITRAITRFATRSRYPDSAYDLTEEDSKIALKYAEQVLDQIR